MISMHHRAGRALFATACAAAMLLAALPFAAATGDSSDTKAGSEATDASHGGAPETQANPDERPEGDSTEGPADEMETSNEGSDADSTDAPAAEAPADEPTEEAGDAEPESGPTDAERESTPTPAAPPAPPPAPAPAPAAPAQPVSAVDVDDDDGSTFATSASASSTFSRDVDLDEDDVLALLALGGGLRHRGLFYDSFGFGSPYSRLVLDDDFGYRPYSIYGYGGLRGVDCIGSECYRVARGDNDRTVVLVVNATSEGRIFDYDSGVRSIRAAGEGVTRVTLDDGTDVIVVRSPPAQPGTVRAG